VLLEDGRMDDAEAGFAASSDPEDALAGALRSAQVRGDLRRVAVLLETVPNAPKSPQIGRAHV
jgi:hypothetical protein